MKENNNYKKYISEDEEIRYGFKVTSNRKKVWNIQLGLLEEIKKICKKHNIKYYADGGTLLGAIRHEGFIPWDDDMDFVMFRDDYEKFVKIAKEELPENLKLYEGYCGFAQLSNLDTAILGLLDIYSEYGGRGISIDIFPIDYASKFYLVNFVKSRILRFLRMVIVSQTEPGITKYMKGKYKIFFTKLSVFIFKKINYKKVYKIREKITKKVFFKGDDVYSAGFVNHFFPKKIYDKSYNVKFENTSIIIPAGFDTYLKVAYGNYMEPVIYQGGHHCRYSVNKSYKEIIKTFDKEKTNEENCKKCKDLFIL